MIAWNFQRIVGTCQFRVPWFGYPCGYSSLTRIIDEEMKKGDLFVITGMSGAELAIRVLDIPDDDIIIPSSSPT